MDALILACAIIRRSRRPECHHPNRARPKEFSVAVRAVSLPFESQCRRTLSIPLHLFHNRHSGRVARDSGRIPRSNCGWLIKPPALSVGQKGERQPTSASALANAFVSCSKERGYADRPGGKKEPCLRIKILAAAFEMTVTQLFRNVCHFEIKKTGY